MDTAPKIVLQNPFRILGVYANSPKRDVVSNKGKATAFLKVNKPVEYPLDLKGILPAPNRTLDLMSEAEAHLAIAKEQIKYAQFWFLQKMSPLDDIAFNHLLAGNMAGAIEIWSKQESLSSLQNRLVCYLIEGKHELAVKVAERLYEKFGNDYISKVDANCTLQMTAIDLLHQFVDSLGEEIGMQTMLGFTLGGDTKAYISCQTIGPLINKISSEVDKTKKVDHKDPKARIEAARKLVANTKVALSQLKSILPATDSQYQMIADKLGLEILQCGIDYFLKTNDEDKHETTMKMLKYANSVVVGTMAKGRCADQIKELEKVIENLPPKEIREEDSKIKELLIRYVKQSNDIYNAKNLLGNTKPHLQSIKRKLGNTNANYLKLSTIVVQTALHTIVEEVNNVQKGDTLDIGGIPIEMPDDLLTPEQRRLKFERIKKVVGDAWKATIIMDEFDLEPQFKSHYNQNRSTLKSMCSDLGISIYVSSSSTSSRPVSRPTTQARPSTVYEREYGNASAGESLWEHIKSHNSSKWQAALIVTIIGGIIGFLIYYNNPYIYDVDEKFKCIAWGTGIGAISWFCILVDNDNKSGDWGDLAARGGCYGVILFLGLFLFYWIYKIIRLVIDGIKGA